MRCLTNGGVEELWIVTALSGWRSWTKCRDFPSALRIQNQCKWYAVVDGLYTPEAIQSLIICIASVHIEGRMGMFHNTQGVWGMYGQDFDRREISFVKLTLFDWIPREGLFMFAYYPVMSFNSSGHSHFVGSRSNVSVCSCVKHSPGVKLEDV